MMGKEWDATIIITGEKHRLNNGRNATGERNTKVAELNKPKAKIWS